MRDGKNTSLNDLFDDDVIDDLLLEDMEKLREKVDQ